MKAQLICCIIQLMTSVVFYFKLSFMLTLLSYFSAFLSLFLLGMYIIKFFPKFLGKPVLLTQLFLFWASYATLGWLYWFQWISTFELCICFVYVSWDLNGQIVTHDVVKETLPIFKPIYFLIPVGVMAEYYYFNPLLWLVDSRNNIHLTTLALWVVMAIKNFRHHIEMENKLLMKAKKKKRKNKNKNKNISG